MRISCVISLVTIMVLLGEEGSSAFNRDLSSTGENGCFRGSSIVLIL